MYTDLILYACTHHNACVTSPEIMPNSQHNPVNLNCNMWCTFYQVKTYMLKHTRACAHLNIRHRRRSMIAMLAGFIMSPLVMNWALRKKALATAPALAMHTWKRNAHICHAILLTWSINSSDGDHIDNWIGWAAILDSSRFRKQWLRHGLSNILDSSRRREQWLQHGLSNMTYLTWPI